MFESSQVRDVRERVSRKTIVKYRETLAWLLHIPAFEPLFEDALRSLEIPGARKGINLRGVVDSLLIENRYSLVRLVFSRFKGTFQSVWAEKLQSLLGLDLFHRKDLDEALTDRQWLRLRDESLYVLAAEHRKYKRAQAILFYELNYLVEIVVNRTVFDPAKRGDAVQEGCLGLIHAIDKTDDGDTALTAYAGSWIKRYVKNHLMGQRFAVYVPINLASRALTAYTPPPTDEQDKGEVSLINKDKLASLIYERLRQPSVSIEEVMDTGGRQGMEFKDTTADDPREVIERQDLCDLVQIIINRLTDKQKEVVALRFGMSTENHLGETLASVSEKIGISHQQVSMREKRALKKIEQAIQPYLEEIYS